VLVGEKRRDYNLTLQARTQASSKAKASSGGGLPRKDLESERMKIVRCRGVNETCARKEGFS